MAVENLTATVRGVNAPVGKGDGGNVKCIIRTVEVTAAASSTSTYSFGKIPSNARVLRQSTLHFDDLASTGSPTIDVGLFAVDGNITDDDDALTDGIDVATAAGSAAVVKDIVNAGLPAWDHVNGQASDPGGLLEVKATIKDADTNTGGTMTMELMYIID